MEIKIDVVEQVNLVRLSGILDSHATGQLYDVLVELIEAGNRQLVVDLSALSLLTRPGCRGLIVAARLMQTYRGAMRICGARGQVNDLLRNLGHDHLLKLDPTYIISLARLSSFPVTTEIVALRAVNDTAGAATTQTLRASSH